VDPEHGKDSVLPFQGDPFPSLWNTSIPGIRVCIDSQFVTRGWNSRLARNFLDPVLASCC
jgi:hypothetical protein